MKKLSKSLIAILLVAIFISCQSSKQPSQASNQESRQNERGHKPPGFKELLAKMDTNKDGKLSKTEVNGPIANDFEKIDSNKDGFISKEEFKKAPNPQRPPNGDQGPPPGN